MFAMTILRISRSMSQGLRGIQIRPCLVAAWCKALPRLLEMSSGSDILNNRMRGWSQTVLMAVTCATAAGRGGKVDLLYLLAEN